MNELKITARGALRQKPGLLAKLELRDPPPSPTSSAPDLSQKNSVINSIPKAVVIHAVFVLIIQRTAFAGQIQRAAQ